MEMPSANTPRLPQSTVLFSTDHSHPAAAAVCLRADRLGIHLGDLLAVMRVSPGRWNGGGKNWC